MKFIPFIALFLTSAAFGQQVDSKDNFGSLTPPKYSSPFKARTAHNVGDPITVIISESNISNYQSTMQNNKKETVNNGPNSVPLVNWLKVGLLSSLTGNSSSATDQQLQTSGQSTQNGTMTAKISVLIKKILPNGTLVVAYADWTIFEPTIRFSARIWLTQKSRAKASGQFTRSNNKVSSPRLLAGYSNENTHILLDPPCGKCLRCAAV